MCSSDQVKAVFLPVMTNIKNLVRDQITTAYEKEGKQPKAILLAGGFGSNKYLFQYLQEQFGSTIEIVQLPHPKPWSAICRGAVHRAKIVNAPPRPLNGSEFNAEGETVEVISRVSRNNYGIAKYVSFIEGYHLEEDRFPMDSIGKDVAINQMHWYLKQVSS
jgi:hypothetical protein